MLYNVAFIIGVILFNRVATTSHTVVIDLRDHIMVQLALYKVTLAPYRFFLTIKLVIKSIA